MVFTRVMCCSISNPDSNIVTQAADVILKGGLVVYPTDTFYGLGGDPGSQEVIRKIFRAKGRPEAKPLPLIIDHKSCLKEWIKESPKIAERLIELFWPGPLTLVFHARSDLPTVLTAGSGKIGIRWPRSIIATAIAASAKTAIISTSANLSGRGGITDPRDIIKDLYGLVDLIIDAGKLHESRGSTVVDVTRKPLEVIREGDIPKGSIMEIEGYDTGDFRED